MITRATGRHPNKNVKTQIPLELVDPLLHSPTVVIRRRFDEEANMQFCDFCVNMILGVIPGAESHYKNKKIISLSKNCFI